MATTGEAVALAFETHEEDFAAQVFEGGEKLFRLLDVAAQILLAVDDEQGRLDIFDVLEGRVLHITIKAIPRCRLKFIIGKSPAEVATAEVRGKVGDGTVSNGDFETVRVTDKPVGHETTVATTRHTHTLLVNIAFLQQSIYTCHNI